ncbi:ATP-binding protein [Pseudonocardia sp. RS11V-5]|uniref:ATP-binding protein n=1 Tax=Pseudonocardia terrae TaxID=2905831 RepID=UPI001E5D58E6|nr:ATP-binding protein [Pseudonocardia terrae]MCE3556442.1 ATP-binding protein [Pseudonocardia terrae]
MTSDTSPAVPAQPAQSAGGPARPAAGPRSASTVSAAQAGSLVASVEDAGCLSALRAWLRAHLPAGDRQVDAELMCTELVTNALEHARGPRTVRLDVVDNDQLTIAVDDADPATTILPPYRRAPRSGTRGRGLALVAALGRWGITPHMSYKTVWATLALA